MGQSPEVKAMAAIERAVAKSPAIATQKIIALANELHATALVNAVRSAAAIARELGKLDDEQFKRAVAWMTNRWAEDTNEDDDAQEASGRGN